MPLFSRRNVLRLSAAAGLLALAPAVRAIAADRIDHARLLANLVRLFAGTPESNRRSEAASRVTAISETARQRLAALDSAGQGELFAGVPLGTSETNLVLSYLYLYDIALATRTPGSPLLDDAAVQRRVVDGLAWLHEHHLADQARGYYGNWFSWEIAIPMHATRTLALLGETVKPELTRAYVASLDAYLRNGRNGDVDLDSRFHTGANLADITTNRILQGALTGDDARVGKAVADQATAFETIDPYRLRHGVSDGYYADGSFVQHHSVAYTGSYGIVLLSRITQTVQLLDGAVAGGVGKLVAVVRGWIANGFAPLIFEGWMMEAVKGRAVSRTTTGYQDTQLVLEAVVGLAGHAPAADARALGGYLKHVVASSAGDLGPARFVSPVSVVRYADILADASIPAADLVPPARHLAFNAMDRTVHRRPRYAFALARSSDRISRYEYMNGENLRAWFQGEGAHHLYLSGEDQRAVFGVDYYTTVSPYRLAGVLAPVEERKTVPELYGRLWYENPGHPLKFTAASESQNTYVYFPRGTNGLSGGVTLGGYGTAAMVCSEDVPYTAKRAGRLPADFVAYRNARGTRSWFLLDEEIVVLAADVAGQDGRSALTTVDSRIAATGDRVELTGARWDGGAWSRERTDPLRWLRYANQTRGTALGYLFLTEQPVAVELAAVTASRRTVRAANPDTQITRNVFGATVTHPAGGGVDRLAYALVPHATEAALRGYRDGRLRVLANTARLQAVQHTGLGLLAANSFTPGRHQVDRLVVDGPACVLTRRDQDRLSVAVSDPTMGRDRVSVLLRGPGLTVVSADPGVRVRRVKGGTLVEAAVRRAYGRSFAVELRGR